MPLKETVLYKRHNKEGAHFGEFNGFIMPLWYKSSKSEHLTVLNNIGLFDTSHMSILGLENSQAKNLLQRTFTRDLNKLDIGKALYGLFLRSDGTVIDDAVIYRIESNSYVIVINSGMSEVLIEHLEAYNESRCEMVNYTGTIGKLDLQGPKSLKLMERIFPRDLFNNMIYFSSIGSFYSGEIKFRDHPILISRSGYTGEFGFELYIDSKFIGELWDTLLLKGEDLGIKPCGLAARDSLRVGAKLPLSNRDIGSWIFSNTPWDYVIDNKGIDYIGKDCLKMGKSYTYAFVGYNPRKLKNIDKAIVTYNNKSIGKVLTCITEVSITRYRGSILSVNSKELPKDYVVNGLVAGYIKTDIELSNRQIVFLNDNSRQIEVEIRESIRGDKTVRKSVDSIRRLDC